MFNKFKKFFEYTPHNLAEKQIEERLSRITEKLQASIRMNMDLAVELHGINNELEEIERRLTVH